jgi:hypothetical protein
MSGETAIKFDAQRSLSSMPPAGEIVTVLAIGNPHETMYPLHRFVHWMAHEDGTVDS